MDAAQGPLPRSWCSTLTLILYLEGQGDLVSRLIMGISRVTIWVIGIINLLPKSPSPSKYGPKSISRGVCRDIMGRQGSAMENHTCTPLWKMKP